MKTKKIEIMKPNEMIRGKDVFSLDSKRCLNSIIYIFQYNYSRNKNIINLYYIDIPFKILRKMMNLQTDDNYVERIKKSLIELMETIELNNWRNPIDGITYKWYGTRILNEASFFKNEKNEWIVRIQINNIIKNLIIKRENFTKLEIIPYVNKLKTRYSTKIYEFLYSFRDFNYIELDHKYFLKLLGLEKNKTYKYFSKFIVLLERQIKEINQKTNLNNLRLIPIKGEKKIKIIINPKSKKKTESINIKKEIEKLSQNLFTSF